MILALMIWVYIQDCKQIGKNNLAVPFSERLNWYFILIVLPVLYCIVQCYL